jgi:hypothetical protein
MYPVTEKYIDMAGKYMVRVLINDTDTIFLKFQHDPTDEEIQIETQKYLDNLIEE